VLLVTSLFDLLSRLLEGLFAWLPRPVLVAKTSALVRWTLARDPVLKQGLVWVVPLIHSTETVDLRTDAYTFEPQVLWTKDGREAAIGMVVLWRVDDPLKLCELVNQLAAFVSKTAESVLPPIVGEFDLEVLKRKAAGGAPGEWAFDTHLRVALNKVFNPYGIEIESARLNYTSDRVRTLKLIGGGL
jgi:regulator of protease activity HflC (stomatin/prohibitin superfamily)